MSNSKKTEWIEEKFALYLETFMRVNKLDGCPSNSFLTLLICLQCSDNDLGGGNVSRDVLYEPGGKVDMITVVFSRYLSCMPSKIKIVLEEMNA